jgi:hypothetical protein
MNKVLKIQELIKVNSSNVEMIGFDDNNIFVQFKNGGIYQYHKTDREVYDNLKKSESIGKHLNTSIKGRFEFNKLEDTTLEKKNETDSKKNS